MNKYKIIIDTLKTMYPDARCELNHDSPYELLIATILSAQSTDKRVNIVTKDLFKVANTAEDMLALGEEKLKDYIRSIGFYNTKSKNIILASKDIIDKFDGEVPRDMKNLTSLAGVGRKTANVIRGNIFDMPSIVVDTHVKRITKKLGLTESEDPTRIEYELMEILPKDHWILWNTDLITLGRTICIARREKCDICFLNEECPSAYK